MYLLRLLWAFLSILGRQKPRTRVASARDTKLVGSGRPQDRAKISGHGSFHGHGGDKPRLPMTRSQALSSIRGRGALVPDLLQQFPQWTLGMNPNVDRMKEELHDWIVMMFPENPKKAAALNRCTFAEFVSMVQPQATWEGLRVAVYLNMWLFLWDDWFETSFTTDTPTRGHVSETCTYITQCLLTNSPSETPDHADGLLTQFKHRIAEPLFALADVRRRAILLKELLLYVKAVEAEQKTQAVETVGTVDEYWTYRGLSGAVRVCLAINEPANNISIPVRLSLHPLVSRLWDLATRHICTANDLYSCRKEVSQNILGLLPLLYAHTGSLQAAVDTVVVSIREAGEELEACAEEIRVVARGMEEQCGLGVEGDDEACLSREIEKVIQACKDFCVGNIVWSLVTERYGMAGMRRLDDGGIELVV